VYAQLIGKHGLITLVPFFGLPVAAALVALEKIVDVCAPCHCMVCLISDNPSQSFAFLLLNEIPTRKDDATAQFTALSITLTLAQKTYSPSNNVINV
jgi:hypothetical protein